MYFAPAFFLRGADMLHHGGSLLPQTVLAFSFGIEVVQHQIHRAVTPDASRRFQYGLQAVKIFSVLQDSRLIFPLADLPAALSERSVQALPFCRSQLARLPLRIDAGASAYGFAKRRAEAGECVQDRLCRCRIRRIRKRFKVVRRRFILRRREAVQPAGHDLADRAHFFVHAPDRVENRTLIRCQYDVAVLAHDFGNQLFTFFEQCRVLDI